MFSSSIVIYFTLTVWINICELIILCIFPTGRKERWIMMYLYLKKRRFLYLIKNEMAKFKENENSYISDINVFPLLNTKK